MAFTEFTPRREFLVRVSDYNLDATLDSGQAFRWRFNGRSWTGVIGRRWVRLTPHSEGIHATTAAPTADWDWLTDYLRTQVSLGTILARLPHHPFLSTAIQTHYGLRLLRQDPWECLASFILSSTKQIVQIKEIVDRLCTAYGDLIETPPRESMHKTFPSAQQIAALKESELRGLGMGFRAPYLMKAAQSVADGRCALRRLAKQPVHIARSTLMELAGVGRKIADCVLLFALGFDEAFPVDVWMMKTLQSHWFANEPISRRRLIAFAETHFGCYGGYAQQYLFHFARTQQAGQRSDEH